MIVHKIDQLLVKTAEITGYPKEQVAHVIEHSFKMIYNFMQFPYKAGFRIPYLGAMRTSTKLLKWYIPMVVLKKFKNNKISKERFQAYWKLRELTRKDEERRNFKQRYNLEFKPHWRQDSDSIEGDTGSYED